jgi:hypothetical protein
MTVTGGKPYIAVLDMQISTQPHRSTCLVAFTGADIEADTRREWSGGCWRGSCLRVYKAFPRRVPRQPLTLQGELWRVGRGRSKE